MHPCPLLSTSPHSPSILPWFLLSPSPHSPIHPTLPLLSPTPHSPIHPSMPPFLSLILLPYPSRADSSSLPCPTPPFHPSLPPLYLIPLSHTSRHALFFIHYATPPFILPPHFSRIPLPNLSSSVPFSLPHHTSPSIQLCHFLSFVARYCNVFVFC